MIIAVIIDIIVQTKRYFNKGTIIYVYNKTLLNYLIIL